MHLNLVWTVSSERFPNARWDFKPIWWIDSLTYNDGTYTVLIWHTIDEQIILKKENLIHSAYCRSLWLRLINYKIVFWFCICCLLYNNAALWTFKPWPTVRHYSDDNLTNENETKKKTAKKQSNWDHKEKENISVSDLFSGRFNIANINQNFVKIRLKWIKFINVTETNKENETKELPTTTVHFFVPFMEISTGITFTPICWYY